MKKFILGITCLFTSVVIAQKMELKSGNPIVFSKDLKDSNFDTRKNEIIGYDDFSFYTSTYRYIRFTNDYGTKYYFTLEKHSQENATIIYSKEIPTIKVNGNDLRTEKLFFLGKNIYMAFSGFYKSEKKHKVFFQKIDPSTGIYDGEPIEVFSIDINRKKDNGIFQFEISDDKLSVLIRFVPEIGFNLYDNEPFGFSIVNQDAKIISKSTFILPLKDKRFKLNHFKFNNDGNIYCVAKIDKNKTEQEKGKLDYFYELISFNCTNKSVSSKRIDLKDKEAIKCNLSLSKNADVIVSGLTDSGVFFTKFDQSGDCKIIKNSEYSKTITEKFNTSSFYNANSISILEHEIKNLFKLDNETTIMISEQEHINFAGEGNMTFSKDNIIATSFNQNGEVNWMHLIPKHQINYSELFMSYFLFLNNTNVCLIYNDGNFGDKQRITSPAKKWLTEENNVPVIVTLSKNGNLNKQVLFKEKNTDGILFDIRNSLFLNNNLFILNSRGDINKDNQYQFHILKK